jgi:hypothetical protein
MAVSTVANPSQDPSYLQKITQRLDPEQIAQEENTVSHLNTAAKVLGVSALLLGLAGIAAAIILPPFSIPIMLAASALFFTVGPTGVLLSSIADSKQGKIDEWKKINTYQANFPTSASIQAFLTQKGITWNQIPGIQRPDDLLRLKPLLALYQHKEEKLRASTTRCQEKLNEIDAAQAENSIFSTYKLINLHNDLKDPLEKTLKTKTKLIFINALLRRLDYTGTRKQTVDIEESSYTNLKYVSQNPEGPLLIFKNRSIAPITVQEFKQMSDSQLGQRMAAAMA